MPELPEVETVVRGLESKILNKTIISATLRRKDLRIPFPKGLAESLSGRKITSINRRAKYILIHLDNNTILVAHLGMSGSILIRDAKGYKPKTHDHVLIFLDNGQAVILNDPRRFGLLTLIKKAEFATHKLFSSLGLEPLTKAFTGKALYEILKSKNTNIKNAIMDQASVVGVGNIYASESLYRSGILPTRSTGKITPKEAEILTNSIKYILCAAIEAGGSTISDYRTAAGKNGKFQMKFQVYGRKGKKCVRCNERIKSIKQNGRSTFYCSACQT